MGSMCSGREIAEERKEIRRLSEPIQRIHKLLLLGTGDGGKTTFYKQLTDIYDGGFEDEVFLFSAKHIQDSVVVQMKNLLMTFQDGSEDWKAFESDLTNEANIIKKVSPEQPLSSVAPHITVLWNDTHIRNTWVNRKNLGISDSAPHFFNYAEIA